MLGRVRIPTQSIITLNKASFSTAKATTSKSTSTWKPTAASTSTAKPSPVAAKVPPPSKQPKKDIDLHDDSIIVDTSNITTPTTPLNPLAKPNQPFAKKLSPVTSASRIIPQTTRPATPAPTTTLPPRTTTPTPTQAAPQIPTSIQDILAAAAPITPTPSFTPATPAANPAAVNPLPVATPASKPKPQRKRPAPAAPAQNASAHANTAQAQSERAKINAERTALQRDLAGRSPQQLLNQLAQLQHNNNTLQSQLVYHSAVDAIYGETGFNNLRNLISEFNEEESLALKTSGFDGDSINQLLEAKQRDLCNQFTQSIGGELSKHITSNVKRLKDQHRQSSSAATATQQTLRNAGVPDSIIAGTLTGLQPHLDELQIKIVRWEKLKADIDLLLATYSANH